MAIEVSEATTAQPHRFALRRVYSGWWVLTGMVVALVIAEGVTFGSLSAYIEPLENRFGWSRAQVSLGFSVTVGAVGLFAPIIGRLVDSVGPRRLMLVGAPLCAISFVLLAYMRELWQWYVYLGLSSFALGLVAYIPAQALAVRWFDEKRALATSIIGASVWMGQLIMLPVVQIIITNLGWGDAFLYSGIFVLAAYAFAFLLVRDRPTQPEQASGLPAPPIVVAGLSLREAIRTPLFWCIVGGLMLFFFVIFGWLSQGVPYYRSVGFSETWAAQIVSLTAGGAVIWLLTAGTQLERFRRPERVASVCVLFVAAALVVLYIAQGSAPGVGIAVVLYVIGFAATPPLEALIISRAFGLANFATIMGTAFMFQTIAIFFSPIIAGAIYDAQGTYDLVLLIYACCAVGSSAVFLIASRLPQPFASRGLPA